MLGEHDFEGMNILDRLTHGSGIVQKVLSIEDRKVKVVRVISKYSM